MNLRIIFLVSLALPLQVVCTAASPLSRAFSNAPDGYAPKISKCSSQTPKIRSAHNLSSFEISWLRERQGNRLDSMQKLLTRLDIKDFDVSSYFKTVEAKDLPNIAIAVSGGGYRALMNGAGALAAFDDRSENTTSLGQLGGLLQSATYISGLSGGSWLLGSVYINNFTTIDKLLSDKTGSIWEFENSVLMGPEGRSNYYRDLIREVDSKSEEGFQVSLTDYWGRALSYQLINASDGGPGYTWSSISLSSEFKDGLIPMPIIIALERTPGQKEITLNSSVFEINPWELGTWDPTTYGFMPLDYLGSNLTSGELSDDKCIRGYDNAGFLMGTSSSLFNQALLQINNTDMRKSFQRVAESLLESLDESENDIAIYKPNPFFLYGNAGMNQNAKEEALLLVDGGEDLQNIPFQPLLQQIRGIDVIIAVDSSADTQFFWPNGTSMVATYERNSDPNGIANSSVFPLVPDQNTFVNQGLNKRPTFFGCSSQNDNGTSSGPLVIYIPNSPFSYFSNVSTFDLEYTNSERDSIILNGYNVATMGNGSTDSGWPVCVGCALLSRSFEKTISAVPPECLDCFEKYCWNGTVNSTPPALYEPTLCLESNSGDCLMVSNKFGFLLFQFVLAGSLIMFVL